VYIWLFAFSSEISASASLGKVLEKSLGAETSGDRLEAAGQGAKEGGLPPAVAGEEEMGAAGELDLLPEAGERTAVANFKTGVEMDGWG
jgi:hypothetical protein